MLQRHEIADPESCLNKADPDEPLFVLRAHDPLAASCVRSWCNAAAQDTVHSDAKVHEAKMVADAMDRWRQSHA